MEEKIKNTERKSKRKEIRDDQIKQEKDNQKELLPIYKKINEVKDLIPPTFVFEQKFEGKSLNIYLDECLPPELGLFDDEKKFRSLIKYHKYYVNGFEFNIIKSGKRFVAKEGENETQWYKNDFHLIRHKKYLVSRKRKDYSWKKKIFPNYEDTVEYLIKRLAEETDNK